jgi:hypothetical protein
LNGRTIPVDGWHLAAGFLIIISSIVVFIVAVAVVVIAAAIVAVADSSDLVGFLIKCLAATLLRGSYMQSVFSLALLPAFCSIVVDCGLLS